MMRSRNVRLAVPAKAGTKVAVISAMDKLPKQLGSGLGVSEGRAGFSPRRACGRAMEENGIEDGLAFLSQQLIDMCSAELTLVELDEDIEFFKSTTVPERFG